MKTKKGDLLKEYPEISEWIKEDDVRKCCVPFNCRPFHCRPYFCRPYRLCRPFDCCNPQIEHLY
ncbi:MAG: hypothetical protein K0R55_1816 [Sporomusa sp.]|jgi:hypothetical protein|nr:hypothetical protein [Sporomusa sp.]